MVRRHGTGCRLPFQFIHVTERAQACLLNTSGYLPDQKSKRNNSMSNRVQLIE
jgi:hypothetical protein